MKGNFLIYMMFQISLFRLEIGNIPCPHPILLNKHVLVMEFIGVDGW